MKLKTIKAISRFKAIEMFDSIDIPFALISISDYEQPSPDFSDSPNAIAILKLAFDDTDAASSVSMSDDDAAAILDFVESILDECELLLIHCGAGQSRSAGVAAALSLLIFGNDLEFFGSFHYTPNMLCYRKVLNASGFGYGRCDEARAKRWEQIVDPKIADKTRL